METIVFVHGLGSGPRAWHPQRIALQGHYRVVTTTLPGHGDQPGPFTLRTAVEAVIDQITDGAHLVGIAGGGTVALLAAMSHNRDRLATLTLSAPITHRRISGQVHRALATVVPLSMLRTALALPHLSSRAARTIVAEDLSRCGRATVRQGLGKLMHTDLRPRLKQVTIPTLVLAGQQDIAGVEAATETARLLPQADLRIVPDAGQLWNLQLPNTFNRTLTGFIDAHTSRSVSPVHSDSGSR